ncbi:MAG TPA: dTDP-4-dehydrorhamnose reductase [Devosia sp.]|mgnify:CR=1 FL=1|nr:dTDP-4-dehydrorhamnose reductase [Devosia sp.]
MRILVTGRAGQVALSLAERAEGSGHEVVLAGRPELDLAQPATIFSALEAARAELVINAAAYTAVDAAESDRETAFAVNAAGAGEVAAAAARLGIPVLQISTDYVFDGLAEGPYAESAATAPAGVYGASKLAGEQAVAAANPQHLVVRTAWVYSPFGRNFVRTMLRLAETRDEVGVVADQFGNPTSALDIADGLFAAATRIGAGGSTGWGTYHLVGSGEASWADLATQVFETSRALGGPHALVRPITTADYPTPARRPANSRLSTTKFAAAFGWTAPDWRESTAAVVRRLLGA